MGLLGVLLVPATLLVVSMLLLVTAWLEETVLSARSLILRTARSQSRYMQPERSEQVVADQSERLLRSLQR